MQTNSCQSRALQVAAPPLTRVLKQRNALGEPVKVQAHWESNVHKVSMLGSRHGTHHSWRYMEGGLMAVRTAMVTDKGSEHVMHWYLELISEPERVLFNVDGGIWSLAVRPHADAVLRVLSVRLPARILQARHRVQSSEAHPAGLEQGHSAAAGGQPL